MENAGVKRMSDTTAGLSPAPKDHRIGEQSPTMVDIDKGQAPGSMDETGGLAPTPAMPAVQLPLLSHRVSPSP